ncbi:patatin family protein [Eubacteriaceae bacterium ES2]|nr:patatin family protein [Eubacteriaceae bacterium ES2]
MEIINNINDAALIFEGGGMRASYTAGILNVLLENKLFFNYVAGISAGSSHTVNYLSRDPVRSRKSFVELVNDPKFGGWGSFLKGKGFFNAQYLYEQTSHKGGPLEFDLETFRSNPAKLRIGAFCGETGKMIYYEKKHMQTLEDIVKIVRSSSSMPVFMPPTVYQNRFMVDGGLGGGIPLDIAIKDGYQKYFVVLTQEKGYRKRPMKLSRSIRFYYRKYPLIADAMIRRHLIYNRTLDQLEELEKEGKAYLVYPDSMLITNREMNREKLEQSFSAGYKQGERDVARWRQFLTGVH